MRRRAYALCKPRANPGRDKVTLRGYRFEPLVLALVALAALPAVSLTGPQDRTRYELTRHLVLHHTLTVEPDLFDRSVYGGHAYSDKAPGMSFFAVPAYEAERLLGIAAAPDDWKAEGGVVPARCGAACDCAWRIRLGCLRFAVPPLVSLRRKQVHGAAARRVLRNRPPDTGRDP